MSRSSKSPRKVILVALAVGRRALPDYAHRFSPKVFTQPQLFACLAFMAFLRTDYRGVEEHLRDCPYWRETIGLTRVPDHATLHRAHRRLLTAARADKLLAASLEVAFGRRAGGRANIRLAAADSTGMETGHRSAYFVRRKARGQKHGKNPLYQTTSYTRYPKLTTLIDTATHLILAALTGTGPRPDIDELAPLLDRCPRAVALTKLLADAGFDSEPNHQLARDFHGIQSLMPAKHGRPTKGGKPFAGRYRRLMSRRLRTKRGRRRSGYTQRWQVETVMSMIKRNLGDELSGQTPHARNRQMRLLVLVHNCMILLLIWEVCDGAGRFLSAVAFSVLGRVRGCGKCRRHFSKERP